MATAAETIRAFADAASAVLPHHFDVITEVGGTPIPTEALSEDHTLGLYLAAIPRKMRENLEGFREVEVADFVPQVITGVTRTGLHAEWFLEYPGLREVRFRAARLQYLEDDWWGLTSEVKYPAATTLSLLHLLKQQYGSARLYLNTELPMPLWLRAAPIGEESPAVQVVIQARGEGRVILTNIHSECPMHVARQFFDACRSYYRVAPT